MAGEYDGVTAALMALPLLERFKLYSGTAYKVDGTLAEQAGLGEGGQDVNFTAYKADLAAVVQMAAALADGWTELSPRTVVRLTSASFYEAGNKTADYPANRAVVLAQTASGVGYVVSSTYNSGASRTEVTVTGITVDTGLTQAVLGLDPKYGPKLPTSLTAAANAIPVADAVGALDPSWVPPSYAAHGWCRLVKSGANLVLQRVGPGYLLINGAVKTIPVAGVSLAPTGLTPGTLYYIYAYMSGATMMLEASTTGHSQDATTGVEIKTGDATRTLVGMVRPITGPAFADTAAQRFVASYFNRRPNQARVVFAADRSTSSGTAVELSSSERAEFLCWGDEPAFVGCQGVIALASGTGYTYAYLDTTEVAAVSASAVNSSNCGIQPIKTTASEGYHFATIYAKTGGGATHTWQNPFTGPVANMMI